MRNWKIIQKQDTLKSILQGFEKSHTQHIEQSNAFKSRSGSIAPLKNQKIFISSEEAMIWITKDVSPKNKRDIFKQIKSRKEVFKLVKIQNTEKDEMDSPHERERKYLIQKYSTTTRNKEPSNRQSDVSDLFKRFLATKKTINPYKGNFLHIRTIQTSHINKTTNRSKYRTKTEKDRSDYFTLKKSQRILQKGANNIEEHLINKDELCPW